MKKDDTVYIRRKKGDTVYIRSIKGRPVRKKGYINEETDNGGYYVIFSMVQSYDSVYLMNPRELFETRMILTEQITNIFFHD